MINYYALLVNYSAKAFRCTYVHNEEVQPTPGIREILHKAIGHPFQQHLQDEDVCENPVGILQDDTDGLPLLDIHILKGLKERNTTSRHHTAKTNTSFCST